MLKLSPKLVLVVGACLIGANSFAAECYVNGFAEFKIDGKEIHSALDPQRVELPDDEVSIEWKVMREVGHKKVGKIVNAFVEGKISQMKRIQPNAQDIKGFANETCHPTSAAALGKLHGFVHTPEYMRSGPFYAILRGDWTKPVGATATSQAAPVGKSKASSSTSAKTMPSTAGRATGPILTRESGGAVSERLARETKVRSAADASGAGKPAARSPSSQPGSSSSSSSSSGVQTILCFRGTVPGPNQRCGTNKGSDAPGKAISK